MTRKSGLGSKFDSIFDDAADLGGEDNGILTMKIGDIEPNREQPRKDFDKESLNLLAQSIAKHGIIQPLTVCERNGIYIIVAGERRWRAAKIAGLSEVPVRVMELTDAEMAQIALIENLQREDLNPIEEANGYRQLAEKYGLTQEDIAASVGKARSSVANSMRLLELPDKIQEYVKDGKLSTGHCKVLLGVKDKNMIVVHANETVQRKLTVRDLEKIVNAKAPSEDRSLREDNAKKVLYIETEMSLRQITGSDVKISQKKNGTISLEFSVKSEEELKELVKWFDN